VIVPCSPSPIDIKGIGETITLLEELEKSFFFVLSRVNTRTRIASDTLKLLSQYGRVAPASLGMWIDYAQGTLDGNTPLDSGNKKIKEEVTQLYEYLKDQLRQNK
jgi:chromosome partitioning protein